MILSGNTFIERHWLAFILFAVVFRWGYVELKVADQRPADIPGRWYFYTPDTHSYIDPIEQLITDGTYYPDYRMPGVGIPYWLFRQLGDRHSGMDGMVVFQMILSGIGVYLVALLGLRLSGSHPTAVLLYALALVSTYSCWYDTSISSDSLAVSVLVIHVFLLQRAIDAKSAKLLVVAGLFLTWIIFLRPVAALLLIPAPLLVLWFWSPRWSFKAVGLFLLPFAVLDSAWIVRNYRAHGEFNPLTNEGIMPDEIHGRPLGYIMRFLQSYGGNYIWWEPGADIRWFGMWEGSAAIDNEGRNAKSPPAYAYVPGYTKDSLLALSERIRIFESGTLSDPDSLAIIDEINSKLDRYTHLYREGAPFNYHVLSRFRMIEYLITQNGTETLFRTPFAQLPVWRKGFKLFQMGSYFFAYGIGGIAALWMLLRWRRATSLIAIWVPVIVMYMILVYPLVLRMAEWRFIVHVHPLMLLLATCFSAKQLSALRARRNAR
ncbi:MAG: glycosyltransferase family 39 protein [Flavobacteriales bacterium]|nr:glycosyltransferase family 39 protein [Flavobacteriales bacterium]